MKILPTCPPHVLDVATLPWKIPKSHFQQYCSIIHTSDYLRYLMRKQTVIHLPTLLENVTTLTFELKNFFIWLKVCILSDVGEPIVGCHRWLWKEPVVMCGNWNVRQTLSQQVFRVTTFCINACFQSFSTVICHIVHRAVLKFGPCRNKSLPQASTCPHDCETVGIPPLMSRKTLGILDGGRGGAVDRARRRRGITGVDKGGA